MPIKVSVVVPVYNPGHYLDPCVASLLAQSMPKDELELIFVDDGSTDDTPGRLDELAVEHPQVTVIHQENSGWPGRPRNVGTAAAKGEYVHYVDQDDELPEEALERLYAFARRNDADIVLGKIVGVGRGAPVGIFQHNHDLVTIHDSAIISSLTPHKMFRREFLAAEGLRFPEGRRRLEDHVFVVAAYFAARRISVLSDYVCYVHNSRRDSANAGSSPSEPSAYFANMCEAVDVVDANTRPGPERDRLHRRWLRTEMVGRLRGARFLRKDDIYQRKLFDAIRPVLVERFSLGVDEGLPPLDRLVATLVRGGDFASILDLARWEAGLKVVAHLGDVMWRGGALDLSIDARLVDADGTIVSLAQARDRRVLVPPLSAEVLAGLDPRVLDAGDTAVHLRVVARQDHTGVQVFQHQRRQAHDDLAMAGTVHASFVPDGQTAADRLADGLWDVAVRFRALGWTFTAPVTASKGAATDCPQPALIGRPARTAVPFWAGAARRLRVDVGGDSSQTDRRLGLDALGSSVVALDDQLRVELALPAALETPQEAALRLTRRDGDLAHVDVSVTLESSGSPGPSPLTMVRGEVARSQLSPGRWDMTLRLHRPNTTQESRLGANVTISRDQSASLSTRRPTSAKATRRQELSDWLPESTRRALGRVRRRVGGHVSKLRAARSR